MTDYIVKVERGDTDDVDINSDDVDITAQSTYTVDDLFKRSYGPTIYPTDIISKGPWVDVRSFGASGSAQATTGTIASGSTSLTLTNAKDFADGMGIRIAGAGASGVDLVTTISSGGGTTTLVVATAASTSVTDATIDHDDEAAFEAAIVYAAANDLKVLFVPRASYAYTNSLTLVAGLSVIGYEEFSYTVGTEQQCLQFTLPNDSVWTFSFRVVGRLSDASDVGSWLHTGTVYRYNSSSAALVSGSYNEVFANYDAVNLRCYPAVSTNDLRLNVQGVTGSGSSWLVCYTLDGV